MLRILFFIAIVGFNQSSWAQSNIFIKNYGYKGAIHDIKEFPDGSLLCIGTSPIDSVNSAFVLRHILMRLDSSGNIIWTKQIDTSSALGYDIIPYKNNGFIVDELRDNGNSASAAISILDSNFNVVWNKKIDSLGLESFKMIKTSDGGFALGISNFEMSNGYEKIYVLKMDSSFNINWCNYYYINGDYYLTDIVDANRSLYISTYCYGFAASVIFRIDYSGTVLTGKKIIQGGNQTDINTILKFDDNTFYFGGFIYPSTSSTPAGAECLLLKTDSNLNLRWAKSRGTNPYYNSSTYTNNDMIWNMIKNNNNDLAIALSAENSRQGLAIMDTSANLKFLNVYDGLQYPSFTYKVIQSRDKGYILAGARWSGGLTDSRQRMRLIKTDSLGLTTCYTPIVSFGSYTSPSFSYVNYLPPVSSVYYHDSSYALSVLPISNFPEDIDCPAAPLNIKNSSEEEFVKVFPNPVNSILTIETSLQDSETKIFDILGNKLSSEELDYRKQLDVSQLPKGIYFLQLQEKGKIYTSKFIKE